MNAKHRIKAILSGLVLQVRPKTGILCPADEELAVLLDAKSVDVSNLPVWDHIAQCDSCYEKWRNSYAVQHNILQPQNILYRHKILKSISSSVNSAFLNISRNKIGECLDDNLMTEYIENVLDLKARSSVERHLASCEKCYSNWFHIVQNISLSIATTEDNAKSNLVDKNTNERYKTQKIINLRRWAINKSRLPMFAGAGLASAAVLIMAIVFKPPAHYTFSDELTMLISETKEFSEPVLLTIKNSPGTRLEKTNILINNPLDLAFNAGIHRTFASFIEFPNAQWQESLDSMQDVLPSCFLKEKGLNTCSPGLKASYAAGQWAATVFSICAADRIENYTSQLFNVLNDLTSKLEAHSVDGKFVQSFSDANNKKLKNSDYCELANRWIN